MPLFIFAFLIINRFGTTDLSEILSQLFLVTFEYLIFVNLNIVVSFLNLVAFCLSFAVLLKAAQFFFYP